MSALVISAEGLSKRYQIGERVRYLALRDRLAHLVRAPFRWGSGAHSTNHHPHIWALRDVSFDLHQGEVVGLIGRNGAGKTTILRILARITRPTSGRARVRGRIASLLEVGTGFHPELTGRENIFLSGAILGMRKREIEHKFDEMVAFSEVEEFLDTPLKHYSTGMQTRLAFAVAAHLEPEILLIDEVLAVGDLKFQRKCLGKMSAVATSGRTILFVSHQMNQIRRLCGRVLWLDQGRVRALGPTGEVVAAYEASQLEAEPAGSAQCFLSWEIPGQGNVVRDGFREVTFRLTVHLPEPVVRGHLGFGILNEANVRIAVWGFDDIFIPAGTQELTVKVPSLPIHPGAYSLVCSLFNRGNNLTGGQLLENWYAFPPLIVDTPPVTHPQDRWAGVLNIPADLHVPGAQVESQPTRRSAL